MGAGWHHISGPDGKLFPGDFSKYVFKTSSVEIFAVGAATSNDDRYAIVVRQRHQPTRHFLYSDGNYPRRLIFDCQSGGVTIVTEKGTFTKAFASIGLHASATATPSAMPTEEPTIPTPEPTVAPTEDPTATPTAKPTENPTTMPTEEPTATPTDFPTEAPISIDCSEVVSVPLTKTEARIQHGDEQFNADYIWDRYSWDTYDKNAGWHHISGPDGKLFPGDFSKYVFKTSSVEIFAVG